MWYYETQSCGFFFYFKDDLFFKRKLLNKRITFQTHKGSINLQSHTMWNATSWHQYWVYILYYRLVFFFTSAIPSRDAVLQDKIIHYSSAMISSIITVFEIKMTLSSWFKHKEYTFINFKRQNIYFLLIVYKAESLILIAEIPFHTCKELISCRFV